MCTDTPHHTTKQALRAQDSIASLQRLLLALLIAEGIAVCLGSVAAFVLVLRSLMRHRANLFGVFLAIPNTALRTLANKSTTIGDEEEDSDDGEGGGGGWARTRQHDMHTSSKA